MRARCKFNKGAELPESYLDAAAGFTRSHIFALTIGKDYTVYALTLRRGNIWYYVLRDIDISYAVWHPAGLFDIVDGRLSRHWLFALHEHGVRDGDVIFAPPEWARDPYSFYDRLSDGEPSAQNIFDRYRDLMELEFAGDTHAATASALGDGWMMCPECIETWRTTAIGELLKCPRCRKLLRNPSLLPSDT